MPVIWPPTAPPGPSPLGVTADAVGAGATLAGDEIGVAADEMTLADNVVCERPRLKVGDEATGAEAAGAEAAEAEDTGGGAPLVAEDAEGAAGASVAEDTGGGTLPVAADAEGVAEASVAPVTGGAETGRLAAKVTEK